MKHFQISLRFSFNFSPLDPFPEMSLRMFLKFSEVALNLSANQTVVDSWKVRMSHRIMVVEPNEVIVNFAADNAGITEGGIMMLNDVLLERSHSEVKLVVRTSFANETGLQYK